MNEEERKERIKFLWSKLRKHVKIQMFIYRMNHQTMSKQEDEKGEEIDDEDDSSDEDDEGPWYLIDTSKSLALFWE